MVTKAKIKKFEAEKVEGTLDFQVHEEVFHAKPRLSGITLINFVRGVQKANDASEDEETKGTAVLDLLLDLLEDALGETEFKRFTDYTSRPDLYVSMETIMEISQYLVGEYTQSPTEAS